MPRFAPIALFLTSAALAQQDHLIGVGFAKSSGPPVDSYPVARVRDLDGDGVITAPAELTAFLKKSYNVANATGSYITDWQVVPENGELAFYFADTGDGAIVRGVDANHNGLLEDAETTLFYKFNTTTSTDSFAPDSLALRRANGQTIVYVALDGSSAKGIWRLVDGNSNGNATDPGEANLFVGASKGLTVAGKSGPVALTSDRWQRIRVTPSGKVLAYNSGPYLTTGRGGGTQNPDMFCWYSFTDNAGVASATVLFNPSKINGVATHPDFDTNGKFPLWDVKAGVSASYPTWNNVTLLELDTKANPGFTTYYFGATYQDRITATLTGANVNAQNVCGLFYRWLDSNNNDTIDGNEIQLYANISNTTYNSVPPCTFTDRNTAGAITTLSTISHDIGAADGFLYLSYENGVNDCIFAMKDANNDGVIQSNETTQPWFTPGGSNTFPFPYSTQFGPYTQCAHPLPMAQMPGPFANGILPEGDGCPSTSGLMPLCDALGGEPKVGSNDFTFAVVRGMPNSQSLLILGTTQTNLSLSSINMPGCFLLTDLAFSVILPTDAFGASQLKTGVPNNPGLVGAFLYSQWAIVDLKAVGVLPVFTSNRLKVTIQP